MKQGNKQPKEILADFHSVANICRITNKEIILLPRAIDELDNAIIDEQRACEDILESLARRDGEIADWERSFENMCHCLDCGREWIGTGSIDHCPFCQISNLRLALSNIILSPCSATGSEGEEVQDIRDIAANALALDSKD